MFAMLTIALVAAVVAAPFVKLAAAAIESYRQYILKTARGEEVDPSEGLQLARDANRSAIHLQADVECAAGRFENYQRHTSRDWNAEVAAAMASYRAAVKDAADADAALEEARNACRAAHERCAAAMTRRSTLDAQRQEAERQFTAAMKATAGPGRDYSDWQNFKLAE